MSLLPAQTIDEIKFYLLLHGLTQKSHAMVMVGDALAARYACTDRSGREVVLDFEPVSARASDAPRTPSKLIDAGQWLAISDRLASRPDAERAEVVLASLALDQVLRFCGTDAAAEPGAEAFFTADGARYRDEQPPGTFRRERLAARLEAYKRIVAGTAGSAPASPAPMLVPILKKPTATILQHCVHMPVPGNAVPRELLVVCFAENTPQGYVLLSNTDWRDDGSALLAKHAPNLLATPRDLVVLAGDIAVHAGKDLAADLLLHEGFLKTVGERLGTDEMWIGVPHRNAFYALRCGASAESVKQFCAMVETDYGRASALGVAAVSDFVFRVKNQRVVELGLLEQLRSSASGGNWLAAFVFAFLAGVAGMGIGVGIIASQNLSDWRASVIVFGLAGLFAASAFVLGFRWGRWKQLPRVVTA